MTRILRESAEVREQLDRARSSEDMALAKRQSAACLALIDGQVEATGRGASRQVRRRGRPPGAPEQR